MKPIFILASAVACLATAAHADPYTNLYGNTLTMTAADGKKSTVFVNQDMSWEQHLADGTVLKGTYAWKDAATACFTIVTPPPKDPKTATNCFGAQSNHNVGESWSMNGADGKPNTMMITAGR